MVDRASETKKRVAIKTGQQRDMARLGIIHRYDRTRSAEDAILARSNSKRKHGAEGIRTPDPRNAIAVLYQLSYDPVKEF
jgi:hypothetical protein